MREPSPMEMVSGFNTSACSNTCTSSPTWAKRAMKSGGLSTVRGAQVGEQREVVASHVVPAARGGGGGVALEGFGGGRLRAVPHAGQRGGNVLGVERVEQLHGRAQALHLLDDRRDARDRDGLVHRHRLPHRKAAGLVQRGL